MRFHNAVIDGDAQYLVHTMLVDGAPFDTRIFTEARGPAALGQLTASAGGVLRGDIAWTDGMVPLVTEKVRVVIDAVSPGSVQWLPVTIEPLAQTRYVMNVLYAYDVLDNARCKGMKRTGEVERPDGWWAIFEIHVRPDVDPEHRIFRVSTYRPFTFVADDLRQALDDKLFKGLRYQPVR